MLMKDGKNYQFNPLKDRYEFVPIDYKNLKFDFSMITEEDGDREEHPTKNDSVAALKHNQHPQQFSYIKAHTSLLNQL